VVFNVFSDTWHQTDGTQQMTPVLFINPVGLRLRSIKKYCDVFTENQLNNIRQLTRI
jgi:hypothetical protein